MTRALTLAVLLALAAPAFAQNDPLTFTLGPIERIEQSDILRTFGVLHSTLEMRDVTVEVGMIGPRTVFLGGQNDANWSCVNGTTPYQLFCTTPLIRAGESLRLQIYAGPLRHGRLHLFARARWQVPEGDFVTPLVRQVGRFARDFIVTNTGGRGEGTLRAAIEAANADPEQVPSRIVFNIAGPVPDRGWFTIYPNTPLPAITARDVEIDGGTQTELSGDTNPLGPEIELHGAATWFGNGLHIAQSGLAYVRGLAIGGFPWNGIAIARDSTPSDYDDSDNDSVVEENYIGTDPTGTRANPNGGRGIAFDHPARNFIVSRNIISGNARSGLFFGTTTHRVRLTENRIGIGSNGLAVPNGASGVYIGGEHTSDITLERNTIAHNAWFGVAIDRRLHRYTLTGNSITRNGFIGIDRGLDGFDGYAMRVDYTSINDAQVPPPRLSSAVYDPSTNTTAITGTYFPERGAHRTWQVTLYASSVNDGQGETVLGSTSAPTETFTFTVPGNLTGKFITATGSVGLEIDLGGHHFWHSEFSESIAVSAPIQ